MFYLDTITVSGAVAPARTERYVQAGEIKGSCYGKSGTKNGGRSACGYSYI